jgi:hypothetical protein
LIHQTLLDIQLLLSRSELDRSGLLLLKGSLPHQAINQDKNVLTLISFSSFGTDQQMSFTKLGNESETIKKSQNCQAI